MTDPREHPRAATDGAAAAAATGDPSGDRADVAAVKAALARLAQDGERPDPDAAPAAVVDEAAAATGRLDETAAFLRADGPARLRAAVERLRAQDRAVTADRGAAVLESLATARRAARGERPREGER